MLVVTFNDGAKAFKLDKSCEVWCKDCFLSYHLPFTPKVSEFPLRDSPSTLPLLLLTPCA